MKDDRPPIRLWKIIELHDIKYVWAQYRDIHTSGTIILYNCYDPNDRRTFEYILDVAPGHWTHCQEISELPDMVTETIGLTPIKRRDHR